MRNQVIALWKLLDDIDTLDDACKSDDATFRKRAYEIQRKRLEIVSGEELDALATPTSSPAGGDGPDDATPEMIDAALKVDWSNEDERGAAHNIWHAMRAAMPKRDASSPAAMSIGEVPEAVIVAMGKRLNASYPQAGLDDDDLAALFLDGYRALATPSSPVSSPSPAGGAVTGAPAGWAAVYDGQMKSCHRSRDTCVADAEHYQAIHPVHLGPAWRHQED